MDAHLTAKSKLVITVLAALLPLKIHAANIYLLN